MSEFSRLLEQQRNPPCDSQGAGPEDLLRHRWGGVTRMCLDCRMHASPESIERAQADADIRNAALEQCADMAAQAGQTALAESIRGRKS